MEGGSGLNQALMSSDAAIPAHGSESTLVSPEVRHNLSDSDDDLFMDTGTTHQMGLQGPSGMEPTAGSSSEIQNSLNDLENTRGGSTNDLELQAPRKLSTRERITNAFHHFVPLRQTYERINNGLTTGRMQANTPGRFIGHGTDGVFRNLMAKPDTETARLGQEQNPPPYWEAAADVVPQYWESTAVSPLYEDEVFVDGLPVGNIANYVWNVLVTVAFQFVGFVLCYLLHTSHAAKEGSRAGLGATLVFYGWNMVPSNFGNLDTVPIRHQPDDPNQVDITHSLSLKGGNVDTYKSGMMQPPVNHETNHLPTPYFAYGLIALGLFIISKSFVDYYRVKQIESRILAPHRLQQEEQRARANEDPDSNEPGYENP